MAKLTITEFAKYLGVSVCTVNKAHVAITGFPLVGLAHCQCRTQ
jgi:DNA-binding MurR/RpiR family transcriptional regulator